MKKKKKLNESNPNNSCIEITNLFSFAALESKSNPNNSCIEISKELKKLIIFSLSNPNNSCIEIPNIHTKYIPLDSQTQTIVVLKFETSKIIAQTP